MCKSNPIQFLIESASKLKIKPNNSMKLFDIQFKGNDIYQFGHVASCHDVEDAITVTTELLKSIQQLTIEKIIKITIEEIE